MSKIFQILNNICHWDATNDIPSLEYAVSHYAPDIHFEVTPDYVFEGWGFDNLKQGDDRFVKPTPPEGWEYDDNTGTFYQKGADPGLQDPRDIRIHNLLAQLQAETERREFLEDCIAEMAMQVYSDV